LILGAALVMALRGLPGAAAAARPAMASSLPPAAAAVVAVQMILGFFATAGLLGADWGSVSRDRGEVQQGGLVCVAMAAWIVATLAILTVAGARSPSGPAGLAPLSFCAMLPALFGDWIGGGLLLALSLTALAPGCYAAFLIGTRMFELEPRRSRSRWTLTGSFLAWVLVMLGERVTLYAVFSVVGALLAPVAGALAADFLRSSGRWPGARTGVNRPGLVAWGVGVVVGLTPLLADAVGGTSFQYRQPAVLHAYLAAFVVYYVLARMGGESPTDSELIPAPPPDPGA
jgi:cytosine permease